MITKIRPAPPSHDIYRNLHSGTWSLVDRRVGKVAAHPDEAGMADVSLVVQPAGNRKVRETKKKLVHAFVRGRFVDVEAYSRFSKDDVRRQGVEITYNPYKHTSFVEADTEREVKEADYVFLFSDKTVWAINPR